MRGKARLRARILVASLGSQPVRALIAGAMVSLGVASTLVMVALSTGARVELEAQQESIGRNLLFVKAGYRPLKAGRGNGWFTSTRLKAEETAAIERDVPAVARAIPVRESAAVVRLGRERMASTVRGVTPEFLEMRRFALEAGRSFLASDGAALRRVAVVGGFVKERLAGGRSLLGATVRINNVPFLVVGELRAKGAGSDGSDQDDQILIPFETAMHRLENVESVSMLVVQGRDEREMADAVDGVRRVLRASHSIDPDARDDFDILLPLRQSEAQQMSGQFMRGLSRVLVIVTVMLGAVGVFAVSYLNVTERTEEIGLRMAVGATRLSVAVLFVLESSLLSAVGGIVGLVLGAAIAALFKVLTVWPLTIDVQAIVLPLAIAGGIGVLCSLVPAWRASRVMPAVALAG